jgi:hypothetical protein
MLVGKKTARECTCGPNENEFYNEKSRGNQKKTF